MTTHTPIVAQILREI